MPAIFPVSREFGPETDAYGTGPTTIPISPTVACSDMRRRARPSLSVLTSLRFFAAAAVVGFHIIVGRSGDTVPIHGFLANLANGGYAAVTFFFILSGFILTYAHAG